MTVSTGAASDLAPATPPIRLLLVDDAEPLRRLYSLLFEAEPDFVVAGEAADGEQGIVAARALQPDVVLLDIAMPVMDGLEAIPGIRDAAPDAAIVMCTAVVDERVKARALDLGAIDFIEKGHDPRDLIAQVRLAGTSVGSRHDAAPT